MRRYSLILKCLCIVLLISVYFIVFHNQKNYEIQQDAIIQYISQENDVNQPKDSTYDIVSLWIQDLDSKAEDINTLMLEDLISKDQYIEKAEVYLDVIGRVCVRSYMREPFLRVIRNDSLYYCDSNNVVLPDKIRCNTNLLVLGGDWPKSDFDKISKLAKLIYNDKMLNNLIGGIYYDSVEGYRISSKICDLSIQIGDKPTLDLRQINMIDIFYNFLLKELGCDYCNKISVKYSNQIICIK